MKLATVNSGILYRRNFAKLDSITITTSPIPSALAANSRIATATSSNLPLPARPHGTSSTLAKIV